MKIALLLTSLSNSGPIVVAYDLTKLLLQQGHYCEIFYFDEVRELDFPCKMTKLNMLSSFNFESFDIIHCHGFRPDLFVTLHKPLKCKVPVCTTIHSYLFRDHLYQYGKLKSLLTARMVLAATIRDDKIIVLSKDALEYYSKYIKISKLTYAYNTRMCDKNNIIDEELKNKILSFKKDSFLLGANCALNARKGLAQIISALPFLPKYKFCIVGGGPEKDNLINLAKNLKVFDRVLFLGQHPAAYRFLIYYDAYVMPSYSEGFPLAMLEAADYGKAILSSDISIFNEIFDDTEIVKFKLDDIEDLVQSLIKLKNKKEELGIKVKERFDRDYSPNRFVNRHLEIYKSLILQKEKNNR